METLQQQLISASSYLTGRKRPGYFGDTVLRYHDLALPYWKAFVNAPSDGIDEFTVSSVELPSVVWQTITPKINNIKTLSLTSKELGGDRYLCLSRFLSGNSTLEELSFKGNDITDLHAAKSLSSVMKNHPTLQKLHGIYTDVGGNYRAENPTPDIAKEIIDGCENLVKVHLNRVGMDDACEVAYGAI